MRFQKPLLLIILIIALVLRFYKLGQIPNGLYQDETAIGYNAYSILSTGKDEHNASRPLYFKSFGDQKMPVYIYLTTIPIKLFGLTAAAVRLPSAAFGFFSVILFFFYLRTLTKNDNLSLIATALLAVNPWHIFYSRAAFEVSLALFFLLWGALLLHTRKLFVSALCFLVVFYSYNLTRLLSPLLFFLLLHHYRKEVRSVSKVELFATAGVAIAALVPFVLSATTSGGAPSAAGTLITTSAAVQAPLVEFRSYMIALPALITKLLFNSWILTFWQYVTNIASYVSVPFFFLTGPTHGNHGIGTSGLFYLVELPFLFSGFVAVLREKAFWVRHLLMWAGATIAVAALTREAPHATRSFFLVVPMITLIARGLITNRKNAFTLAVCVFFLWNIVYFYSSYFIRFPVAYAKSWRSADYDLSLFIQHVEPQYDQIVFDKTAGFIYTSLLFYSGFSPSAFQAAARWSPDDREGFSELLSFGKYQFRDINGKNDLETGRKTLIVTTPDRKPQNARLLQTFNYPNRPVVIALKQQIIQYPVEETAYIAVELR